MSRSPGENAFAIGKALVEVLGERLEDGFTSVASDLSRFSAEQQEQLQQFAREVLARAEREAGSTGNATSGEESNSAGEPVDLQATIDELRAAIAGLRAELNAYKVRQTK